jgi:hypothetical protein
MAAPLNTCTAIEQRGVECFLWAKYMEAKDMHKEMLPLWAAVLTSLHFLYLNQHNPDLTSLSVFEPAQS